MLAWIPDQTSAISALKTSYFGSTLRIKPGPSSPEMPVDQELEGFGIMAILDFRLERVERGQ